MRAASIAIGVVLAIGMLPSLTALSEGIVISWPTLGRYLGPINVLKLASPLLLAFVFVRRRALSRRLYLILGVALTVGTVFAVIAAWQCAWPHPTLREWSVILLGLLAATCFTLLPERDRGRVVVAWVGVVLATALLDALFPSAIQWLYAHLFDPDTGKHDLGEVGWRSLGGVFGRQSLAKLLAWIPWVLWVQFAVDRSGTGFSRTRVAILASIAVLCSALILATSQRGAFVGAVAGWLAFAAHAAIRRRNRRFAIAALGALVLSGIVTVVVVPRHFIETRLGTLIGRSSGDAFSEKADVNRDFRLSMWKLSVAVIADRPLGNACITAKEFEAAGVHHHNHSHNLILQQFRERGWIWGLLHLALWVGAWAGAWSLRSERGSALVALLTSTLVFGMFDHPWFVLNHSMVLWLMLLWGLGELSLLSRPAGSSG